MKDIIDTIYLGTRYSRLSDFTVFPESLLFERIEEFQYETNVMLNLLRLEVLSAILFNEQIAVPMTVYVSSILGYVYGEIQDAIKGEIGKLPLCIKHPFRPALTPDYSKDERGSLCYQLDRMKVDHDKGFHWEFDNTPSDKDYRNVRSLLNRMCESLSPGYNKHKIDEGELIKTLGQVGPSIYHLLKSYAEQPNLGIKPIFQTTPELYLGKCLYDYSRKSLKNYEKDATVRDFIIEHCENKKLIGGFFDLLEREEKEITLGILERKNALLGRGQLKDGKKYEEYREAINKDLIDFVNYTFHQIVKARVNVDYASIEFFQNEFIVNELVSFDKRIFDCTDQYSLDNLKFSNGYPIVNRSTWTSVWKNLAYVVEQPKWREMIIDLRRLQLELKNEPLKNEQLNKEQLKRAENIFNYFMKTAKNSDYWIRFELIESNNHSSFLNDRGLARAALFTKSFGSVIKFAPGCDIVATIFSEYIFPTLDALKEGASQLKEEKVSKKDHSNLLMKLGYEKRFH